MTVTTIELADITREEFERILPHLKETPKAISAYARILAVSALFHGGILNEEEIAEINLRSPVDADLGIDSLEATELLAGLEDILGVDITGRNDEEDEATAGLDLRDEEDPTFERLVAGIVDYINFRVDHFAPRPAGTDIQPA